MTKIKNNELSHSSNTGASNIVLGSSGEVTPDKFKIGSDAAGDIAYYNGTKYTRLAPAGASKTLKMNSSNNAPEWITDVGGKLLQHKYTKTYYSSSHAWPTSETDISGASIAMTKQSSGSSKYIFRVNFHIRYVSGSINAWIKIFKGSSCIDSDMDSNNGLGYLHSATSGTNVTYSQMWIDDAATDTYKLRYITGSTNFQFWEKTWLWFEIMEVEP